VSFSPLSVVILKGSPTEATSRPHPALAAHVSLFWELRLERGPHQVRSLPDGCTDVTFDVAADVPAAYLTGPQRGPRTFDLTGQVALFGVRLLPGAAARLLGRPAGSDDLWVPLASWLGPEATALSAAVQRAADTAARIELVERWLLQRLVGADDAGLARAIEGVFRGGGEMKISELARAAAMSERALSRAFAARVGLPPKPFSRIVRFQRVLRRIDGQPDWALLAGELGYFDQAHMIREFKALFGCTPGEATALVDAARPPP
jgi:AraC-like DNA-binding protein